MAKKGIGSLGHEGDYFGPATKKAVIAFQKKNKLKKINGIVDQATRDILNATQI